jgi:hypothetical protein
MARPCLVERGYSKTDGDCTREPSAGFKNNELGANAMTVLPGDVLECAKLP